MKKTLLSTIIVLCFSGNIYSADDVLNKKFPTITGISLSNNEITFPDDIGGRVTVLSVAFKQKAQLCINTWADELLPKYGIDKDVKKVIDKNN